MQLEIESSITVIFLLFCTTMSNDVLFKVETPTVIFLQKFIYHQPSDRLSEERGLRSDACHPGIRHVHLILYHFI